MDRRDELAGDALAGELERRLELGPGAPGFAAQRVQLARDRLAERGRREPELESLRRLEPLLRVVPAPEPDQVGGAVDEHEAPERGAHPEPCSSSLTLAHRRLGPRVVAA